MVYHPLTYVTGCLTACTWAWMVVLVVGAARSLQAHRRAEAAARARGSSITTVFGSSASLATWLRVTLLVCTSSACFFEGGALVAAWLTVPDPPLGSASMSPWDSTVGKTCQVLAQSGPGGYVLTKAMCIFLFFLKSRAVRPLETHMSIIEKLALAATGGMFGFAVLAGAFIHATRSNLDQTCGFEVQIWMLIVMVIGDANLSVLYLYLFLRPLREIVQANNALYNKPAVAAAAAAAATVAAALTSTNAVAGIETGGGGGGGSGTPRIASTSQPPPNVSFHPTPLPAAAAAHRPRNLSVSLVQVAARKRSASDSTTGLAAASNATAMVAATATATTPAVTIGADPSIEKDVASIRAQPSGSDAAAASSSALVTSSSLAAHLARGRVLEGVMRTNARSCIITTTCTFISMCFVATAHLTDSEAMLKLMWALGNLDLAITCTAISMLMRSSVVAPVHHPSLTSGGATQPNGTTPGGAAGTGAAAAIAIEVSHSRKSSHSLRAPLPAATPTAVTLAGETTAVHRGSMVGLSSAAPPAAAAAIAASVFTSSVSASSLLSPSSHPHRTHLALRATNSSSGASLTNGVSGSTSSSNNTGGTASSGVPLVLSAAQLSGGASMLRVSSSTPGFVSLSPRGPSSRARPSLVQQQQQQLQQQRPSLAPTVSGGDRRSSHITSPVHVRPLDDPPPPPSINKYVTHTPKNSTGREDETT